MNDYRSEAAAQFPFLLTSGHDHKAWAKRIMYRDERKDSNLTTHQVSEAKMALGLIPMPNEGKK